MPEKTLPALSLSNFHSGSSVLLQIEQVCRIADGHLLGRCTYEYSDCLCGRGATVTSLETEQELCLKHFAEVSRG